MNEWIKEKNKAEELTCIKCNVSLMEYDLSSFISSKSRNIKVSWGKNDNKKKVFGDDC